MTIVQVSPQDDFKKLAEIIRASFATVATEFGLTTQNCPTNSAFITADDLGAQLTENREFYCALENGDMIGFIAIEKSTKEEGTYYIEKLSVLPEQRHGGIGAKLMNHACTRIQALGGTKAALGLINANAVLKTWYLKQGFMETAVKAYPHLPFEVCFMERMLT